MPGDTNAIASAVAQTVADLRERYIESSRRQWDAATNGTPENLEAAALSRANYMRFWANASAFDQYRTWDQTSAAAGDPLLERQIRLLHLGFAQGQRDEATIEAMNKLMLQIDDAYTNFRATVGGSNMNNNAIENLLAEETDSEVRREAWEASKEIGPLVAAPIRQLAHLRNKTAHALGYSNYHRMSLELDEIDPDWLYKMLSDLATSTEEQYRQMKAELDAQLSERYHVPVADLRPWHYTDLFFQRAPKIGSVNLDPMFADQNLEALATKTFDGLGMDVRDILARSDLYEREKKDQHAFCTHIDREGDVRTLCNLQPVARWMDTLLHELGHGVYDKYIPQDLPWLLRTPSHILSTESMALLMGAQTFERDWLTQIRGLADQQVEDVTSGLKKHRRMAQLIFARWVMVMVNFERGMYEDPDRDLDALWWDLVERYQLIHRPDDRKAPDWATKYHVALAPAYYQNYLIGEMVSVQWERWLRDHAGGVINSLAAGEFFRKRVFGLGAIQPWNEALEVATGEKLNIQYWVDKAKV
jgi:peptidyl-dipeptidase A